MTALDDRVEVHLLALPVALAAQARQHFEELTREFVLIAEGSRDEQHVPARLLQLVDALTRQFGGINDEADQRLEDAIDAGLKALDDHVLRLPPQAGPAAKGLGEILDEADEYCRSGEHLLTLAASPELVAYRRWYLSEVLEQLDGRPPTPWSDGMSSSAS
jgi:hypothetical protein